MQTTRTDTPLNSPWGEAEKSAWLAQQSIERSYHQNVLTQIEALRNSYQVEQYGALSYDPERYPLHSLRSKSWNNTLPTVLVTGGVHGYETSGILGALRFLQTAATDYASDFNLIVAPCVSPWGFETINRWNPQTDDPNRSFSDEGTTEESSYLIKHLKSLGISPRVHIDLHETTDTDNTVFRPAKAARDGIEQTVWNIPDGFYLVGDSDNPQAAFQQAVIDGVRQVTHIAPADEQGQLIGVPLAQDGVINYDYTQLGLCGGFSGAEYTTTTEVYPDSPQVDSENCIQAQVAAITSALDYLRHSQSEL